MALSDQAIPDFIAENPGVGREAIRRSAAPDSSETTMWRALSRLVYKGKLEVSGRGRATGYTVAGSAVVRAHLSVPYNRRPPESYRPAFLDSYVPGKSFYLSEADRVSLLEARQPVGGPIAAGMYARRILEQLLVDLSWASSRMEGNTYDILQTERLIRFGEEAAGKDRKEALMILNHKEAIQYVVDNLNEIEFRRNDLFATHALLSDGLLNDPGMAGRLRVKAVGISHTSYRPLDDAVTIGEEFDIILHKAAQITDPFEQSFFLLVHIPYLQAFVDINKRTSRIASNIPLLKADLAPMSFMTMDDADYVSGIIGVYELNNVALQPVGRRLCRTSGKNHRQTLPKPPCPGRTHRHNPPPNATVRVRTPTVFPISPSPSQYIVPDQPMAQSRGPSCISRRRETNAAKDPVTPGTHPVPELTTRRHAANPPDDAPQPSPPNGCDSRMSSVGRSGCR